MRGAGQAAQEDRGAELRRLQAQWMETTESHDPAGGAGWLPASLLDSVSYFALHELDVRRRDLDAVRAP